MKERPILFSAPMVRALLAGTKTQTRRIIKPQHLAFFNQDAAAMLSDWNERPLPYGQTGDRLWVREAWGLHAYGDDTDWLKGGCTAMDLDDHVIAYRADWGPLQDGCHWRPSIHMPRAASRITLEITSVRVERLQEISIEDAKAEGAWGPDDSIVQKVADYFGTDIFSANPRKAFQMLWESINGPDSWAANPWVWAIEFRRVP